MGLLANTLPLGSSRSILMWRRGSDLRIFSAAPARAAAMSGASSMAFSMASINTATCVEDSVSRETSSRMEESGTTMLMASATRVTTAMPSSKRVRKYIVDRLHIVPGTERENGSVRREFLPRHLPSPAVHMRAVPAIVPIEAQGPRPPMSRLRAGRRPWHRPGVAGAAAAWMVFRTAACLAAETPPGANPADALERPVVEVIGTSPLPGLGTDKKDVPGNVQVYSSSDLSGQRQSNTTDFLEQNATSVTANAAQGNPFQPDVSFRGFTASPLLGTPQGVSVFQDGVRINEPFGDVVNWDLIPQAAIAGIQVIPGSNPMFGLNTLGGAIAVYTKSGADYPGASAEVSGGSFGRRTLEAEWGASRGPLDLFITGDLFDDQGWADHNPSRVHQLFAKAGWQNDKTDLDVSLTLADNKLQGTQTLPLSLLYDIRQAYTYPDININKLTFLTVKGSRFLSDAALFGGNLYYRHYRNSSVSSNVNDDFGSVDPDSGAVDEIAATNDQSTITQDGYGGGLQVVLTGTPAGMKNQLTFGASVDEAQARFTQYSQDADLTALRGTVPAGEFELQTDADTDSRGYGVFAQNILNLTKQWTLTLSGRYNHVDIRVGDRTGTAPLLNGDTSFSRLNPSAGINFNPTDHLTAYAAYDEGARAPTAIELTCADPNAPCKLPNDFLADPPLKQVVSHTVEVGARGTVS